MAILFRPRKNQELTEERQQEQLSQPKVITPGSATTSAPQQPSQQQLGQQNIQQDDSVKPAPKKSGSGFTNLATYLKANQSGGGLAGRVVGKTTGQLQGIEKGAQESEQRFKTESERAAEEAKRVTEAASRVAQDPSKVTEEDINLASNIGNLQYTGPSDINYGSMENTVGNIASNLSSGVDPSGLVTPSSGRKELLKGTFTSSPYTSGQLKLDEALLQTNPSALNTLREAKVQSQQLAKQLEDSRRLAQQQAAMRAEDIKAGRASGLESLNQNLLKLGVTPEELEKANKMQSDAYESVLKNFAKGRIDKSALEALGLSGPFRTYGLNLGDPSIRNLLTQSEALDAYDLYTPEQKQRFDVLTKVLGNNLSEEASAIRDFYSGKEAAGELDATPYTFNLEEFNKLLRDRQTAYEGEYNPQLQATLAAINEFNASINRPEINQILNSLGLIKNDLFDQNNQATGGETNEDQTGGYTESGSILTPNFPGFGSVRGAKTVDDDSYDLSTPGMFFGEGSNIPPQTPLAPPKSDGPIKVERPNVSGPKIGAIDPEIAGYIQEAYSDYNTQLQALKDIISKYSGAVDVTEDGKPKSVMSDSPVNLSEVLPQLDPTMMNLFNIINKNTNPVGEAVKVASPRKPK